ncbi:MAG: hypothetical protein KC486_15090 [Myxococcales bacterium]|nr:hypothetical protein [Myxococcales bacterium]
MGRPRQLSLPSATSTALALAAILAGCQPGPMGTATDTATGDSADATTTDTATGSDSDSASTTAAGTDTSAETTGDPEPQGPPPGAGKNPFPWSLESADKVCDDDLDNDGNSYTDCEDFSCSRNPSVVACGALSAYESTPELCSNGKDDDYDGRPDCADPDCYKNPFVNVCVQPKVENACGSGEDGDGDGLVNCDDNDCLALDPSCSLAAGKLRVLFDLTLDETASNGPNSDWIVDPWGRLPTPSNPTSRNEWKGSLSSFAFDLYQGGHLVETLTAWDGRLSYGDAGNPQDLSNYDVFVVVEPSRALASAEKQALIDFVDGGGGLLLAANHVSADRDGNGWSAVGALNDLFDKNPVRADPFGLRFDEIDIEEELTLTRIEAPAHPIIAGPAGTVAKIGLYLGSTAHFTGAHPSAGLVVLDDAASSEVDVAAGAVEVGAGRVFFVTDSAILGDGTDSHGTSIAGKDAYNDPTLDHRALFVNAVLWLGGA